jgi:hypothetical protein
MAGQWGFEIMGRVAAIAAFPARARDHELQGICLEIITNELRAEIARNQAASSLS